MFRNNWIRVPLIVGGSWIAWMLLFGLFDSHPPRSWLIIIGGLMVGFSIQVFNWLRVQSKFGNVGQEVSEVRQKRSLTLMQDISRALDTCKLAVESLPSVKLRDIDVASRIITLRSKISWNSWGNVISIKLLEVGDYLTEVEIEAKPFMPTVIFDSGQTWDTLEELVAEIKKSDSQPSSTLLKDGAEMLHELTSRPVNFSR